MKRLIHPIKPAPRPIVLDKDKLFHYIDASVLKRIGEVMNTFKSTKRIIVILLLMATSLSAQQWDKILNSMGVKPGMVIGEVGAGEGYFTFQLAERVGPEGKIFANDINKGSLRELRQKRDRDGITNIETLVGKTEDPLFPAGQMDMVVMRYVFHDLEKPVPLMQNVKRALKPGAIVGILDRDPERMTWDDDHFMTKAEIVAALEKADYEMIRVETWHFRDNIYMCRPKKTE